MNRALILGVILLSIASANTSCIGQDRDTFFRPQRFSIGHLRAEDKSQQDATIDVIKAVDAGNSLHQFGELNRGFRLGLFLLDPAVATPDRIYSAVVLRNETKDSILIVGDAYDVIAIYGADGNGTPLVRKPGGEWYSGPPPDGLMRRRNGKPPERQEIPPGGQVVYMINLAKIFDLKADAPGTFWVSSHVRNKHWEEIADPRSRTLALVPRREDAGLKSIFDERRLPDSVTSNLVAQSRMQQSNDLALIAAARYARTNARSSNSTLALVQSNSMARIEQSNLLNGRPQTNLFQATDQTSISKGSIATATRKTSLWLILSVGLGMIFAGSFLFKRRR